MDNTFPGVFSDYNVKNVGFRVDGETDYEVVDGAGTLNDEFEMKSVTKAKSNIIRKEITGYSGSGSLTITCHVPYALKRLIYGETNDGLQTGVYGLQMAQRPPLVEITVEVEDEDGDLGYTYYPCARIKSKSREIESNGDVVEEVTLEFALSVDENDMSTYTAIANELTGSVITADNWMTEASTENMTLSA